MGHETVVTMFSSVSHAEAAKRSLTEAGFQERDIDIISGERLRSEGYEARHPGFWQRLFGNSLEEDQAEVYDDALQTGGVVLSLRTDEDDISRAVSILDAHEEMMTRSTATPVDDLTDSDITTSAADKNDRHETDTQRPVPPDETNKEEILRLAEERLIVGKRVINEGSTRIRRYTVTDDVSENISLHEQHAEILRRPLSRTSSPDSPDWSEKTIEVEETREQPVISKTAQIKEEVVIRREQSDRNETIHDSVRRQEVDIAHPGDVIDEAERAVHPSVPPAPDSPAKRAQMSEDKRPDASEELTVQKNKFDEKF